MKYLCLAFGDPRKWQAQTRSEIEALMGQCRAYDEDLQQSGHLIFMEGLDWTAMTLRPRNGRVLTTDGPFAETKEQVGGVFLIEARDLNEALRVASKHPAAHLGEHLGWGIEVRLIGCASDLRLAEPERP